MENTMNAIESDPGIMVGLIFSTFENARENPLAAALIFLGILAAVGASDAMLRGEGKLPANDDSRAPKDYYIGGN